ncbi:MAG: phosphoribosylamine--glycine ligase [Rhodospirillales bacterium]
MKVLVVGSGGREHALCWGIAKSPKLTQLWCAPGNAGIAQVADCLSIPAEDVTAIVDFAMAEAVDLVVVGPEAPLVAGLVDRLETAGIKAFGPSAAAARLEGSKAFMKDLCARHKIPTADYAVFDEPDEAKEYIQRHDLPMVVKADGLAAGKGVTVCHHREQAFAAIDHLMTEQIFGDSGNEVVIESFLKGEEASFFALVDGTHAVPLVSAQDHKPAFDGDEGPNTGGMGSYSPAPVVTPAIADAVMKTIVQPTIDAMQTEGCPYKGVLYAGLMIDDGVPSLLEYNVRFGDPECQALVMRLQSDLLEVLLAAAEGRLDEVSLDWTDEAALNVVMATQGYPGHYEKGSIIKGLAEADALEGVTVFHAGTKVAKGAGKGAANGAVEAHGGRVLAVTALGASVAEAQKRAYAAVDKIDWPEGFCRRDIGWRAIERS